MNPDKDTRAKAHKTLDAYLDAGGSYEFVIVSKKDYENHITQSKAEAVRNELWEMINGEASVSGSIGIISLRDRLATLNKEDAI